MQTWFCGFARCLCSGFWRGFRLVPFNSVIKKCMLESGTICIVFQWRILGAKGILERNQELAPQ